MSEPTFKKLAEGDLNPEQLKVYRELMAGPRGGVRGPFNALLRSPVLADRVQKLGEFLRFESSIPARLNEFAILITARQLDAQVEWYGHAQLAQKAGIDAAVIADLQQGRRPAGMKDDEALVYQFCTELHDTRTVGDATFRAAVDRFGENGVIDLVAVTGYYTTLAMVLGVARQSLPDGVAPPLQALK